MATTAELSKSIWSATRCIYTQLSKSSSILSCLSSWYSRRERVTRWARNKKSCWPKMKVLTRSYHNLLRVAELRIAIRAQLPFWASRSEPVQSKSTVAVIQARAMKWLPEGNLNPCTKRSNYLPSSPQRNKKSKSRHLLYPIIWLRLTVSPPSAKIVAQTNNLTTSPTIGKAVHRENLAAMARLTLVLKTGMQKWSTRRSTRARMSIKILMMVGLESEVSIIDDQTRLAHPLPI